MSAGNNWWDGHHLAQTAAWEIGQKLLEDGRVTDVTLTMLDAPLGDAGERNGPAGTCIVEGDGRALLIVTVAQIGSRVQPGGGTEQ
jgi:hypothetical protein